MSPGYIISLKTDIAIAGEILRENGTFGIDTMTPGQQQILRDVSALLRWHGIEGDIANPDRPMGSHGL